ncbi:integrase core domain-containing protein [Bosea sp. (in: a-proteobacteria)]
MGKTTHEKPRIPRCGVKLSPWHRTLKNRILLENYYLPGNLERQVAAFVELYNHARHHESLDNLTPPTSTSAADRPSSPNAKGSSARPSSRDACSITSRPPNLKPR